MLDFQFAFKSVSFMVRLEVRKRKCENGTKETFFINCLTSDKTSKQLVFLSIENRKVNEENH